MSTTTPKLGLTKPAIGEAYSLAVINNNSDLIDAFATAQALTSEGGKTLTKITANSGAITALTVIQNIASFSFKGGRRYIIRWNMHYQGSVAGNYANYAIHTCSTADAANLTTGLTTIGGGQHKVHDATQTHKSVAEAIYEPVSDTTLQIKFTAQVVVGAGTTTIISSVGSPSTISIEDWGDMF